MSENENVPGNIFADLADDVDVIIMPDGHVYMSIHTIDQMHEAIMGGAKNLSEKGRESVNPAMWHGAMWVMDLYMQLHDALDMRGAMETMPDDPKELFDKE